MLYLLTLLAAAFVAQAQFDPPVVNDYNLDQYIGHWYQIADYLQFYELTCHNCTQATYNINSDGTVQVWNVCSNSAQTTTQSILGYAYAPDPSEPAKLSVVFFGVEPKTTNYWICYLGPVNSDGLYSYAVVSNYAEEALYILNREASMTQDQLDDVMNFLKENNFNTDKLRWTSQVNCPDMPPPPPPTAIESKTKF
jgi:apolipoprotein D and lipocalin family protein